MSSADFEQKELYELTLEEAHAVLSKFLTTEEAAIAKLANTNHRLDLTRESLVRMFRHVVSNELDKDNVRAERNGVWFLRLAYYFGECLRKNAAHLFWTTGKVGTAFENHPVIAGFNNKLEAALITTVRNVVMAVVEDGEPFDRIEKAIDSWFRFAAEEKK